MAGRPPIGTRIPDRLLWAVEVLAPAPDDHVLEIGCGTGVAAGLLLQRLPRGRLSAIDRSAAMIRAAEQRNRAAVVAGRARFLRLPFEEATLPFGKADRALAVNVNRFWLQPADESGRWDELLRPGATVALVYQPPSEQSLTRIVGGCSDYLRLSRFSDIRVSRSPRLPAVCVSASWA